MNETITIEEQWLKRKGNDGQEFTIKRTRIQGEHLWTEQLVPMRLSPFIMFGEAVGDSYAETRIVRTDIK